jgi:hypothetical protein
MSADLDREIDGAVRAMLDEEPSSALRSRVLAALEQPGRRHVNFARWAAVAAAATVAVVAVMVAPWHHTPPPIESSAQVHAAQLPLAVAPSRLHIFADVAAVARPSASADGTTHARVLAANDVPTESGVTALERPAALSVTTIAPPVTTTMPSIQPAPLRVSALELPALEMPPDAARGADR